MTSAAYRPEPERGPVPAPAHGEAGPAPARDGAGPSDDRTAAPVPTVLHVDMDAFYASVEIRRRPELRGRPVVVGSPGPRGVVLSATHDVRAYGVHAGQPVGRARRLCPQASFVAPDHDEYARVSGNVMEYLRTLTPVVEPLSLDEAFLDLSGALRRLGRDPARIGADIRARVADEQGITCSVGVASTKFVAKLAGATVKPDGLRVVRDDEVIAFLHPLPVDRLWGVGERTEAALTRLGLYTVGDIAHTPPATLCRALGQAAGRTLYALAWGRDERPVVPSEPERSIGTEETFPADVDDPDTIRRALLRLSGRTGARLRGAGLAGRTVTVKLRFSDFTTLTRSKTLREATDVGREIYTAACALHAALGLERARLRLVGVRVEHLVPGDRPRQLLLGERETGWAEVERAADAVRDRFGGHALAPASLLPGTPAAPPPRPPRTGR
ncbi:DNA polymerase IV [Yinghuangia seranimata]|uniref:DNA polymerase IV n=1 Tax=Yinghuangia seranimata TaxID=408067 RepID=UPI00248CAEED|nr:DNA polymerase IV [Yinghuangia seranimata]MDI2126174.1 DNA polymerase IV [Yinghuangia seranimata]